MEVVSKNSSQKAGTEKYNQEGNGVFSELGKNIKNLMHPDNKNNNSNSNQSQLVKNLQNDYNESKTKDTSSVSQKYNQDEISKKLDEHDRHLTREAEDLTTEIRVNLPNKIQKDIQYEAEKVQKSIGNVENKFTGLTNEIRRDITNGVSAASNKINSLDSKFRTVNNTLRNVEDYTEQIKTVAADIHNIQTNIETTIGQQNNIKKTLDKLQAVLTDKNLEMKKKLPASTHDEETIVKLGEYGKVIFEQLLLAARWYARKKEDLEGIEEERKSFQKQLVNEKIESFNQGKADGKKEVIKDLLEKYDDIVSLMDSQEGEMRVLADYLLNNGLSPIFKKGEVIDVTEENLRGYESQIEQLQVGKIEITQPGYVFDGKILSKAKWQVCKPETEEKADFSSIITNSEDSPETNSENNSENVVNINDDKIPAESTADSAEAVLESEEKEGE